jgi:hypothetical protein
MKIYKYKLENKDAQRIIVPAGARFLSLQVQNNVPFIWALVDEYEVQNKTWFIKTYGTGHQVDIVNTDTFLATYQIFGGSLVYHVFGDLS